MFRFPPHVEVNPTKCAQTLAFIVFLGFGEDWQRTLGEYNSLLNKPQICDLVTLASAETLSCTQL